MLGLRLLGDNLPRYVGDQGSKPGKLAWSLGQPGQSGQVDPDVDSASPTSAPIGSPSTEQVEEDICADLIHVPRIALAPRRSGQAVDSPHRRLTEMGRQAEGVDVSGPVVVGLADHPALLQSVLITLAC